MYAAKQGMNGGVKRDREEEEDTSPPPRRQRQRGFNSGKDILSQVNPNKMTKMRKMMFPDQRCVSSYYDNKRQDMTWTGEDGTQKTLVLKQEEVGSNTFFTGPTKDCFGQQRKSFIKTVKNLWRMDYSVVQSYHKEDINEYIQERFDSELFKSHIKELLMDRGDFICVLHITEKNGSKTKTTYFQEMNRLWKFLERSIKTPTISRTSISFGEHLQVVRKGTSVKNGEDYRKTGMIKIKHLHLLMKPIRLE